MDRRRAVAGRDVGPRRHADLVDGEAALILDLAIELHERNSQDLRRSPAERRFSTPGFTDKTHNFAFVNLKTNIINRFYIAGRGRIVDL